MDISHLKYLTGFGNEFASEAIANTLPQGQNSPQRIAHGLYGEQLSGTAFTAPRHETKRSWLYRIQPSVGQHPFNSYQHQHFNLTTGPQAPDPYRWNPLPYPETATDFIDGLYPWCTQPEATIYLYTANCSMIQRYFYSADGEFLLIPGSGQLLIKTEFGILDLIPGEIAVIPRGIKFQILLNSTTARGYLLENHGQPLTLPELGPIGANGLANPRDFLTPVAHYEELSGELTLIVKFQHQLWTTTIEHSPFDVVAWHGNYVPYKYDLGNFNAMNTVTFDHPDPSIFTVLTSPSSIPGTANVDFVIFPPRWSVAENTFRPPYFHRNVMSEFMGLIHGQYDAKGQGFVPGGSSLHNQMTAHGPDLDTYLQACQKPLKPEYYQEGLAFMLESRSVWQLTQLAKTSTTLQKDYLQCWQGLPKQFNSGQ